MQKKIAILFCFSCVLTGLNSCEKNTPVPAVKAVTTAPAIPPVIDNFFSIYYDITSLPISIDFESFKNLGSVQNPTLNEISGIASSYSLPGTLWCEEDSGNENNIYLMRNNGEFLGTVVMSSLTDRDWEDMSIGPGPLDGVHYIYLAEIGDNNVVNADKFIFRFPEPIISNPTFPFTVNIKSVDKISFNYPDGIKNAEAVMIDPLTKDIYVISKEGQAVIYVARYPQDITKVFTMTKLGVLPISDVTAADISPDGKEILIKNYAVILYWKKLGNETISELLQKVPIRAPYQVEEKGEAVCWSSDGSGYFTTSELPGQPVYFYKRK